MRNTSLWADCGKVQIGRIMGLFGWLDLCGRSAAFCLKRGFQRSHPLTKRIGFGAGIGYAFFRFQRKPAA